MPPVPPADVNIQVDADADVDVYYYYYDADSCTCVLVCVCVKSRKIASLGVVSTAAQQPKDPFQPFRHRRLFMPPH